MAVKSEEQLIERCRAGDMACYGELVRLHQDKVFNMLYYLVGDYDEALDATQETFLKAYNALDKFRGKSSFSTWLHRIAVNTARSMRRRRGAGPRMVPLETRKDGERKSEMGGNQENDPADSAAIAEEKEIIYSALGQISFEHRRLIVLHDIEGHDYSEIAEILKCPKGTVKSRLHRARIRLREEVASRITDKSMDAAESGAG